MIAVMAVLAFIKAVFDNCFPTLADHKAVDYACYAFLGMMGAFIYRVNTRNK